MSPVQRLGAYAFIKAQDHVLLSLLNRGPNRGKWTLVGGGIEFGESPLQALFREIHEEAGLELKLENTAGPGIEVKPNLLDVFEHRYDDQMQFFGVIYTLELDEILPCKSDGDGFSSEGTAWFKIAELHADLLNPSVLKVLTRLA